MQVNIENVNIHNENILYHKNSLNREINIDLIK